MAVHFCPALVVISLRTSLMNRSNSGVPGVESKPRIEQFKESAYLNDMILILARVTYVGNTSMEVRVDSYIEDRAGIRRPINRAYLTMVCLNSEGRPTPIPYGLAIQNESQQAEWDSAMKRVALRKQRRQEGF